MKAVWPDFWGACLRYLRGPGEACKKVGGEAPRLLEGVPGPRGRPDLKNEPQL